MPDNDLKNSLSDFLNFDFIWNSIKESQVLLADALNKAVSDAWATQRSLILFVAMVFLVNRFWEGGMGSLVYNLIYLIIAVILIFIFGWIVIFNIWFMFLYPLSYILTGILMKKLGVWK